MTGRDRLVRSAFELFEDPGFHETTVDYIAARAGVGRATFFRLFPNKEAVIFPDHDAIIAAVQARLSAGDEAESALAVYEAARLVLRRYLAEGELARRRYALTRTVPSLRDAEIAIQRRYQQLFRDYLRRWQPKRSDLDEIRIEVLANAIVVVHNHVLRDWLRGHSGDPERRLKVALFDILQRLGTD